MKVLKGLSEIIFIVHSMGILFLYFPYKAFLGKLNPYSPVWSTQLGILVYAGVLVLILEYKLNKR